MLIINSNNTKETSDRLKNKIPESLKDLDILINYGNSGYIDNPQYLMINKQDSIKRCINKKEMFKCIKHFSIKYIDLNNIGILKAIVYLLVGNELVLRKNKKIEIVNSILKFIKIKKNYDYATIKETKILEYRVLMLYGIPFRIMVKINKNKDFVLKQENSKFVDIPIRYFDKKVLEKLKKTINNIGIDLCGVDLLLNGKYKFKIIEVNSGAGMCSKSVRLFYSALSGWLGC